MRRALLVVLLLSGCTDVVEHGVPARLGVLLTACAGEEAAPGFTHLQVASITQGRVFWESTFRVHDTLPEVAWLPDQGASVVRVLAYFGDPLTNGKLLAWGESAVLESDGAPRELVAASPSAVVRLATVDRFAPTCVTLTEPRAGHSVTGLDTGRVAVIGGFRSPSQPEALASIELADLAQGVAHSGGVLEVGPTGGRVQLPVAHHGAALDQMGVIVIWGGERWVQQQPAPSSVVLAWDSIGGVVGAFRPPSPPLPPRSGHTLVKVDRSLFAIGGETRQSAGLEPIAQVDRLDLMTHDFTTVAQLPEARLDAAVAAFGQEAVVLAGGTRQGVVSGRLDVVHLFGTGGWSGQLSMARSHAAAASLLDGVLVIGGTRDTGEATGVTDWVRFGEGVDPPRVEAGPVLQPRHSGCAATLGDGRVLVLGGVGPQGVSAVAELVDTEGHALVVAFPGPARWQHACTPLRDGTVLVSGGVGPNDEALGDLWRFVGMPRPLLVR